MFDATSIIVGIILGSGIYASSSLIASQVPSAVWLFGLWIAGGVLSLVGALCYAELTTMYPRAGGDYFYITRAYGRDMGFLFAWSELWITRPGNIGALAYIFAQYAYELWPWASGDAKPVALMVYAATPVFILTAINALGVREGKWTQNVLTLLKLAGPLMILAAGLMFAPEARAAIEPVEKKLDWSAIQFGLILVLFTYGGWSEIATVGAEVRNPEKNMFRALILGVTLITVIYLVVNAAFLYVLGLKGFSASEAVAADTVAPAFGAVGAKAISLMITISALGAISAQIFTGARIFYAMGSEHPLYAWLGRWSERSGTPVWSLVLQAIATVVLIVAFGFGEGQKQGAFADLVGFTAPIFWTFFTMVGLSVFIFRSFEPQTPRPFRVPWFPVIPILFCLFTLFMLYSSIDYALNVGGQKTLWWIAVMALGVAMVFVNRWLTAASQRSTPR